MKLAAVIGCVAACALAGIGPAEAGERRPEAVHVTWLRQDRVAPAQRVALTRLLVNAVEGRPLRGAVVKGGSGLTANGPEWKRLQCLPQRPKSGD